MASSHLYHASEVFSLHPDLLREVFSHAKPIGHYEDAKTLNLGFGFLYYGLVRALRPQHVLVIGSGYGFSVVCLALGLKDNGKGQLSFIDPSYSLLKDGPFKTIGGVGFWSEPEKVTAHFRRFGVEEIVRHYKKRSDEFFPDYATLGLPPIDVAFIDGSHAFKDVRYDFLQVLAQARKNTYIFLHDTNIYVREILQHAGVKKWLTNLRRQPGLFELVDFPFASGVALVRVRQANAWKKMVL
ncbi:MAG: class I SAM-dependent methyltransferase [Desulfobacca sp.]